ncbi:MAG: GEVED domain-containing protein [Cyanobacteria bacterium J06634_6]
MKLTRRSPRSKQRRNCWQRYYLAPLVWMSLLSTGVLPAIADGTAAGETIDNTAFGSFESPSDPGVPIQINSNTVTLTVAEIAGIDVAATSGQEAPSGVANAGPAQGDGIVSAEDVVFYTFRITNIGNDQTQFFIPEAPASVSANATFDTATTGRIRVIAYNDGTNTTAVDIPIPDGGLATGAGVLGTGLPNNGSIPVDGFIDVQIPVKVNAGVTTGNVTVVLGNTTDAASQNEPVSATNEFSGANDVTTQDNADGGGIISTQDPSGDRVGGPNTEREASDRQDVPIGTPQLDYGDAPDLAVGTAAGDYETAPGRGPSHVVSTNSLGTNGVDAETTAEQDGPTEDDGVQLNNGTPVTFHGESLIAGQTFDLDITTVGTGVLNAWIDFDGDGEFSDVDEKIIVDEASTGGVIDLDDLMVPFDAAPGTTYARFRYSTVDTAGGMTSTSAAPDGEVEDYEITIVGATPNLRLVKRITRLGATDVTPAVDITTVVDEGSNNDDDASLNWPAGYLEGAVTATPEPGQEVDYTVYFLSDGNSVAANVRLCDLVPANTTYQPGSLQLSLNTTEPPNTVAPPAALTDTDTDTDGGRFFNNTVDPVDAPCTGTNTDGGVYVDIPNDLPNSTATGTPSNAYGFIRFTVIVD